MIQHQGLDYAVLKENEVHELFIKFKKGDAKAREKLILHNMRLVVYIVKRFINTDADFDELISVGTVGLIKSIDSFNLEKNIKFPTYSARCIQNEILMYLRKVRKNNNNVSISTVLYENNEGDTITYGDTIIDTKPLIEDIATSNEETILLREIIEQLPEREKEIIKLHFGFYDNTPLNQKEIAKHFNLSQSYVSRIVSSTVQKIKQKYIRRI